jgi:hypothetical protein
MGVEFGLVVEQKPLPANKARLLQQRTFFQLSPAPWWKQGNMASAFLDASKTRNNMTQSIQMAVLFFSVS